MLAMPLVRLGFVVIATVQARERRRQIVIAALCHR
jgi:hypothetical protein